MFFYKYNILWMAQALNTFFFLELSFLVTWILEFMLILVLGRCNIQRCFL